MALRELQDYLLQLKQSVPGLQLKKNTAAQSSSAPFPITAAADVAAPPEADRYDVSGFRLAVRLGPGVLGPQQEREKIPAEQQQQQQQQQHNPEGPGVEAAVEVEIVSSDLPRALRAAMATELHRRWAASLPARGDLHLALLWAEASGSFVHLITLLPEVLESYQCEDASGSTVRRWAVLSDEASVTVDASVRHSAAVQTAAAAQAPQAAAGAAAGAAGRSQGTGRQQQQPQHGSPSALAAGAGDASPLPRALQQELGFLERRYGLRRLPAIEAATTDSVAGQLAGLHLGKAGAGSSAGAAGEKKAAAASADAVPAAAFQLELQPTDPAWTPSHPPALLLHGWAASSYPQPGSLVLRVSPQQPQLPPLQRQVLDKLLAAEVAAALGGSRPAAALGVVVRHAANHAGQLWEHAEDIAAEVLARRRQQEGAAEEEKEDESRGLGQQQQGWQRGRLASSSDSGGSSEESELDGDGACGGSSEAGSSGGGSSDGEGEGTDEEGGEEGLAGGSRGARGAGHSDAVLPLQLLLEGLELVDCDCLELLRLNLQVACSRCRTSGELSFASAAVALPSSTPSGSGRGGSGLLAAIGECPTCHASWAVELAPKLVHERSNTLAHLRAEGCLPQDLLPSMLAGQCSKCASSAAFRSAAVGRWNERACSSCHTAMRFQFSTAMFAPIRQSTRQHGGSGSSGAAPGQSRQTRRASAAAAADAFNGLLQLGQPLPDRGTCSHYKHSYRWLRFPCCGKRFPCDLCHEELTDGHDMKWATRMVCGYCSLEQPVAALCKGCDKKLAATAAAPSGRRTRFWEGGKGQRDPTKLLANDPRRHRGRYKTKSAKHKRVGQKGKEKKEQ